MGLAQSAEAPETAEDFDLHLDVTLDDGTPPPEYPTPGSAAFTIFARRDVTISSDKWTTVPTGLTFHLPFMLVVSIDSHSPELVVRRTVVDCDVDQSTLMLPMLYRPLLSDPTKVETLTVRRGEPIASAVVLPIARPAFRFYAPEVERV